MAHFLFPQIHFLLPLCFASPLQVLDAAFAKVTEPTTLIEVPLVRDEYKGNASHWAR